MQSLEIKNLSVSINEQPILKDFNLSLPKGEVHALMGPNSGWHLAKVIADMKIEVHSGEVLLNGVSILGEEPDAIIPTGLF